MVPNIPKEILFIIPQPEDILHFEF